MWLAPDPNFLEEPIILGLSVQLEWGGDFHVMLLHRPNDGAAVDRVASQAVKLPAEDSICFAAVEALHHRIEDRPAWGFGGFGFGQHSSYYEPLADGIPSIKFFLR